MPVKNSFTLIELLVVISIVGILAGVMFMVLNPNHYLADSRNMRRKVDLHTISLAVFQYRTDTAVTPMFIPYTPTEICKSGGVDCSGLVDFSELLRGQKYLIDIPSDPKVSPEEPGSGYYIYQNENGRTIVSAPLAEKGEVIEVIR